MKREFFESQMLRIIKNYGAQHYSGDNKVRVKEIWTAFERFSEEDFEAIVRDTILGVKEPPKAAHLAAVWKEIKLTRHLDFPQRETLLEYDPFFPDDEWIEIQCKKELQRNPKADIAVMRALMKGMRAKMIQNFESHKRNLRHGEEHARRNNNHDRETPTD